MKFDWPFLKQRLEKGWLAVSLGENRARFAHVEPGPRPKVHFLTEASWEPEQPKTLEKVAKELHAQRFRCTTVLRPQEFKLLLVEAPNVKREELKAAVRWRIKDMIDYHVDDATIDVLDVPAGAEDTGRPRSMYVVATRADTVQKMIERFDGARLALGVIDIPDTAQRNVAALFETKGRGVLTLSFDEEGGLVTMTADGELYVSRRLEFSLAQLEGANDEVRGQMLDRALVEVQRSLDHFERSHRAVALEKVLVAPMAQGEALVGHLAANLYLPVASMRLEDVMDMPREYSESSPDAQASWLRLIGAGLRVEEAVL